MEEQSKVQHLAERQALAEEITERAAIRGAHPYRVRL